MRFCVILSMLFLLAGNVLHAISLEVARRFADFHPPDFANTCAHLAAVTEELLKTKQLTKDTPYLPIETNGYYSSAPIFDKLNYPSVTQCWRLKGFRGINDIPWYPLTGEDNWSLDDKEALEKFHSEVLPKADDWINTEIAQKGREIRIRAIIFDSPNVERLGRFRTEYSVSSTSKDEYCAIVNKTFTRERGIARKEIAKQLKNGYAIVSFTIHSKRIYGWIKTSFLFPQNKKKKR